LKSKIKAFKYLYFIIIYLFKTQHMQATHETIGQIAARDLQKALIFKKHGLDFCCGGKKTLQEACAAKGLDVATIENELQRADTKITTQPLPYDYWDLDFLADFIIQTHHSYVKRTLPEITAYAAKVARVHGNNHPELVAIDQLVTAIGAELSSHLMKEEHVLFPYIKEIAIAARNRRSPGEAGFGSVQHPINIMEMEHETVGAQLEKIRELSNNYALPKDACATYSVLYRLLDEFENDLHIHVHLENNILFPKALALENQISGNKLHAAEKGNV
jgi:regulator of cell morphogenesis and NO signaling